MEHFGKKAEVDCVVKIQETQFTWKPQHILEYERLPGVLHLLDL